MYFKTKSWVLLSNELFAVLFKSLVHRTMAVQYVAVCLYEGLSLVLSSSFLRIYE